MKTLHALLILSLILTTVGCATLGRSFQDVSYDYDVTTDFSGIKTYNWHPTSAGVARMNDLAIARIRNSVNNQLQAKGIVYSNETPDFLIIMYGGVRKEYTTQWRGWDDDLWFDQGRLKLSFFDTKSSAVIWWAETRADIFFDMEPAERNKVVEEAVARILQKFPPN
jgi:hypothetical protein